MKKLCELILEKFPHLENVEIKDVVMDSRKIKKNSLFFAIQTGNQYIEQALEQGASLVIADDYKKENARVCYVENTVTFMQELAREYRKRLQVQVIAITGSNGKTTTKDICYAILSKKYKTKKTLGNYNNHIGLPFTVLGLEEEDQFAVLEMGMSHLGEIDLLASICLPNYGILTNIGDSHLEFLKTRENVFRAKTELLHYLSPTNVISNGDDPFLKQIQTCHVGYQEQNDYRIQSYKKQEDKTFFSLQGETYEISLEGKHNVMNVAMAIALAKKIGMRTEEIQKNLTQIELSPMRFQRIVCGKTIYINDAYNASPISMIAALASFEEISGENKIAILGDMLELGKEELRLHHEVLDKAQNSSISKILLYGPLMKAAWQQFEKRGYKIEFCETKEEIRKYLRDIPEKIVLLKGSRGMKLEEIIEGE